MVEVAGVEPASQELRDATSTGIGSLLGIRPGGAATHAPEGLETCELRPLSGLPIGAISAKRRIVP